MPSPKVLFLLADGARARFVERSRETGHYVTIEEIDGQPRLRALRNELRQSPAARTVHQSYPGGHSLNRQDFLRSAKEAFAAEVAEKAAKLVEKGAYQGVFLAAPARLIAALRRGLAARATITGELNRDLTKTVDAQLSRWLPIRPITPAAG
ncbi:host attachment protein [Phenylobacterium sp. LjRoot225]|uniref:host attachment protein n=1 Tax=Phenylobacterium sp. LjRoot225 TaxID=3342285 RepID=UPI003ECD819F